MNLFGSTAFEVWDSEKATKIEESPRSKGGPPKSPVMVVPFSPPKLTLFTRFFMVNNLGIRWPKALFFHGFWGHMVGYIAPLIGVK